MRTLKIILALTLIFFADDIFGKVPDNFRFSADKEYMVRLNSGDIIYGHFLEYMNDPDNGEGVKLSTALGGATIYYSEIADIRLKEKSYRHAHRIYLMPTAEGIGENYFISDFELMFLYAGAGWKDWVSVTAGRTIVPYILGNQQVSVVNFKLSPLHQMLDSNGKMLHLALGGNLSWLNNRNRLQHLYAAATLNLSRTSLTANLFYKFGEDDFYDLYFYNNKVELNYPNHSFGLGLGFDTKLPKFESIHIIGEIWNSDVTRPTNSGVLLGVRLCNTAVSADFGLAVFTQPFILPFVSFAWTPF